MKNIIKYKGYVGSVEFSEEDGVFFGKVQGVRALISYEGTNALELINDFHEAIDEYLNLCDKEGRAPEIAYKGSFNVRIPAELHRKAALYAITHELSLNRFIEEAVEEKLKISTEQQTVEQGHDSNRR
ncbi:MAG: type II toxin-antitoxin system HicB family antitoxin [Eubacterium sp.]|nr:type II toxin-antitoxin system HicB family antitoxin [Eubacterium sp.]